MKILGVILSLAICCGNCLAASSDIDGTASVQLPKHIKKGVRTDGKPDPTDIKPSTPGNGINTGFVIIYGHPVKPPYQVRVADNKVLINDVPVGPGATESDTLTASAAALRAKAERLFCDGNGKKSPAALSEEILALFKQSTDTVINARWDGAATPPEAALLVYWKRGVNQSDVRFSANACAKLETTEAAKTHRHEQNTERNAKAFKRALESGKVLYFVYDGHTLALPERTKAKLDEILKDTTLDRKGVTEKLESLGFRGQAARELSKNYQE